MIISISSSTSSPLNCSESSMAVVLAMTQLAFAVSGMIEKKNPSFSIFPSFQKNQLCASLRCTQPMAATLSCEDRGSGLNADIQELCRKGELEEAMRLVSDLGDSFTCLDAETYGSVLQLCSNLESLLHGKQVHSIISSTGVEIDTKLGSKLVSMYVNCGDLREGRRVFDELASKDDPFPWNLLMSTYAKIREFKEGIILFQNMWDHGTKPNARTFSCILKCFTATNYLTHGMAAHGYLQKLDLFYQSIAVGNALIALYAKCNSLENAMKVFDKMPVKDIISWNSIIHGCVANGHSSKAVELFNEMWFSGVDIDLATLVSVLPACAETGALTQGRVLHGYSAKAGFSKEVTLNNSLLDMYFKCCAVETAEQLFNNMIERCIVSWTTMISGYIVNGLHEEAFALFEKMEAGGVEPDLHFITTALHACACSGSLNKGKHILGYLSRNGLESNAIVANALMDMFAKCGDMESARSVFDHTSDKDIISWNTLIGGYSKNSLPNEAFELFGKMLSHMKPNSTSMACMLRASASLSALEKGREMHAYIIRAGFQGCSFVANALVDMYVKCGALLLARKLFDQMSEKDLISWTIMIAGYGMHGHGKEALAIFKEMRHKSVVPDAISFIAILYACSHSGLIDEGYSFFNIMRSQYKIEPAVEHYACVVDLLSRAGRLNKAIKFIESMPVEPDSTVWGALLCGCRKYRDVELAEKVAERVFELDPENTGYYVLLANIYAEAEKWEAVKKLREKIGSKRLRKNPGCSWIEIKSKVHIFVAGDKSHSQWKTIESFLHEVRRRMKEDGYVPRRRYALINEEDEVKEEALCGHSEKLAIAFGILNTFPGKPIRMAKNLRVCGDCHEVVMFISKITGRDILLRDNNRFHHFQEGRCSCRGYW